jgi:hypothetical protein
MPGAGFSEVSTGGGGTSRAGQEDAGELGVVDGSFVAEAGIAARAKEPDSTSGTRTRSDRRIALCTH